MKIRIFEIRTLLESKLKKLGFTASESKIIADEYIQGELKGKSSHGIFTFIRVYEKIKRRQRGRYKIIINKAAYAYIEGNKDIGQIVADKAIRLAISKAKKRGVAMVGGGNIQAFLRPATWAEIAARENMVALCFNFGGGPLMAPTGAREAILSTNPIGIGIPYKPYPFVIDMATSNRAFYNVRLARKLNTTIPKDWGIDRWGKPTADPNKLVAVLPFGGYKGYALALALEILTGPLVKTRVGRRSDAMRGFLFIVIDPKVFTTRKEFDRDIRALIRDVKTAKKIKGVKNILIPGERAFQTEQERLKSGFFDLDERVINEIRVL
ncbi:MAG: Ldh family oxidoreductase [bacterium]|nr:Ldh family oxidoreductase [bacterium]